MTQVKTYKTNYKTDTQKKKLLKTDISVASYSQLIELEFQTKQRENKHEISRHIAIKEKENGMIIIAINI